MKIKKTRVWINPSLGLLFVFSSFGLFVDVRALAPVSNLDQSLVRPKLLEKREKSTTGTSRVATLQRVFKKYWYLPIPVIGAGAFYAYQLQNNSVAQKNNPNSVKIKLKAEQKQSGAAQKEHSPSREEQLQQNSVDAQEVSEQPKLTEEQPVNEKESLVETSISVDEQENPGLTDADNSVKQLKPRFTETSESNESLSSKPLSSKNNGLSWATIVTLAFPVLAVGGKIIWRLLSGPNSIPAAASPAAIPAAIPEKFPSLDFSNDGKPPVPHREIINL